MQKRGYRLGGNNSPKRRRIQAPPTPPLSPKQSAAGI